MEATSKLYEKIPTFDGEKENWEFYKVQMESYLVTYNLGDMLVEDIANDDGK